MSKRVIPWLVLGLLAATPALAQDGGFHKPADGDHVGSTTQQEVHTDHTVRAVLAPVNQVEIIGVITAIDPPHSRVTIAYEPVEALDWPKGTMPFPVTRDDLLAGASVGEKVRFKVENHEIYDLKPY